MKAQLQTAGVVVIALLCGVSQALPQQTGQDSLEACVQTCVDSIIQSGACDDSSNQASCVCGVCKSDPTSSSCIPTLQSCVQSSCPPSFADPTAEYCGTGTYASGSSTSENLYTIQTDTTAWMTKQPTTFTTSTRSASPTGTFNPSSVASPRITTASATTSGTGTVVSSATTSAAPASSSGNAAAAKADLGSPWKGLLVAGLGMMMAVVVA